MNRPQGSKSNISDGDSLLKFYEHEFSQISVVAPPGQLLRAVNSVQWDKDSESQPEAQRRMLLFRKI